MFVGHTGATIACSSAGPRLLRVSVAGLQRLASPPDSTGVQLSPRATLAGLHVHILAAGMAETVNLGSSQQRESKELLPKPFMCSVFNASPTLCVSMYWCFPEAQCCTQVAA